ncbi:MAG: DNA repair protein RecO C-terminal domain-containing protein [Spirochaetes bacterium]|nr:DNA repair protein RecO C-terminal domain-containing protein [Spirochaetota bacterium]
MGGSRAEVLRGGRAVGPPVPALPGLPEAARCDRCGRPYGDSSAAYYDAAANALFCEACSQPSHLHLAAGGLRYLEASASLPLEQAAVIRLNAPALASLRHAILEITQSVLEGELATIRYLGAPPGVPT